MATSPLERKPAASLIFFNGSRGETPNSKFNSQRERGMGMLFAKASAKCRKTTGVLSPKSNRIV